MCISKFSLPANSAAVEFGVKFSRNVYQCTGMNTCIEGLINSKILYTAQLSYRLAGATGVTSLIHNSVHTIETGAV